MPDLLILGDVGMRELAKRSGESLLETILRRHGVRSTLMTSNRPLEDLGKLIGDTRLRRRSWPACWRTRR
jgi:DNA replication protein DnaC